MIFAGRPRGRNTFEGLTSRCTMPVLVRVAQPGQELQDDGQGRPGVGADAGVDRPLEVDALEQLQHHERRALVLAELVDDDDVRVLEPRRRARLAEEPRPGVGVGQALRHDLDRHVAVERLVAAAVDRAHRALAQLAEDLVAADALAGRPWRE